MISRNFDDLESWSPKIYINIGISDKLWDSEFHRSENPRLWEFRHVNAVLLRPLEMFQDLGNQSECLETAHWNEGGNTTGRRSNIVGIGNWCWPSRAKSVTSDLLRGERSHYSFMRDYKPRPRPRRGGRRGEREEGKISRESSRGRF